MSKADADFLATKGPRAVGTPTVLDPGHVAATWYWAGFYHDRGYQPLTSRPPRANAVEKKRPMLRFARWREGGGPDPDWLWDRFPTTNIQLMTGRHWRLAVIDLDGPEVIEAWPTLGPAIPRTLVSSSGGGGRHFWFTLPDGLPPAPKRLLWGALEASAREGQGGWQKHKSIEFLGDRSLVVAPPSIRLATGRVYRFLAGHSPRGLARPALVPRWILDLATAEPPWPAATTTPHVEPRPARRGSERPPPRGVGRQDVVDAIPDKTAVARSWGLRVTTNRPGPTGWRGRLRDARDRRRPDREGRDGRPVVGGRPGRVRSRSNARSYGSRSASGRSATDASLTIRWPRWTCSAWPPGRNRTCEPGRAINRSRPWRGWAFPGPQR